MKTKFGAVHYGVDVYTPIYVYIQMDIYIFIHAYGPFDHQSSVNVSNAYVENLSHR